MPRRIAPPDGGVRPPGSVNAVQMVTPLRPELHRAMRLKAAAEGTTMRVLVMRGLRAIGLPVSVEDEKDRRGARGNRTGAAPRQQMAPDQKPQE